MEYEKYHTLHAHVVKTKIGGDLDQWRRHCGCLKTSDKLKELLKSFPSPPPPSPAGHDEVVKTLDAGYGNSWEPKGAQCISAVCARHHGELPAMPALQPKLEQLQEEFEKKPNRRRTWSIIYDLVQLVQLSVTATALALYYLIYCYMQLVYYTLRSALYFHNADGPMKITIGVVTITSVIVGFNLLIRMERLIGIF